MAKNNKKTKVAITIFLITAIIATALTAVLAFGEKNEGYRTITVIEIGGTVGVVHGNMEYAAYTGMHLEEGYTVVTNGNSYVRLLLDDDKYVKLESGTKAVFSEVSGGKTAIDIERGALVAEVTKPLQVDEDFIVNTPNAVLAVRGTLFRVDLSRNDKGELNTDVMTYGGAVSSKRVQPSGEVEDIEVTIKEGFKATVNMDDKETVYLVDEVKVDLSALVGKPSGDNKPGDITTETDVNGDIIENTPITLESVLMPIVVEDIPDDDLIDIYFASENGHSMFIETKEIEEKIVERNIDVTQKTSVYEIAEKVKEPVEIVIPDDNKSLVTTTEPVTEAVVVIQGPPTDGLGETTTEVTTETTTELVTTTEPTTVTTTKAPTTTVPSTTVPTTTVPSTTAPTTTVPSTTAPTTTVPTTTAPTTTVPSTTAPTTTVPTTESTTVTTTQPTTEETTVHIHTETIEETKATCTETGLKMVKCSTCGEIISETVLVATGHTEKKTTVDATCTTDGKTTVTCTVCNETLSETVLIATGHSEIFSGAKDAHTECSVCYEVLSTSHSYTKSTTNPSCTLDGGTTYVCECGYNYTDKISATGHTEETTTVDATCTVDGKITVSCSVCTETLSETTIPATGHTEEKGNSADIHTKCVICGNTVEDGTYHNYSDIVTTPNSCTTAGVLTRTCNCGWSYTEEIPASHKKSDNGLTCVNGCGGVWVDLNSDNFPDSMFLSYVSSKFNTDTKVGDVALIGEELTGVTTINVAGNNTTDGGYTNLTGIKNFTNLTTVNCAYNSGITSLDLSGLTSLESLDVTGLTNLKTLNISGCTSLTDEKITGLDTCTLLEELNVSGTNLTTIEFTDFSKLATINVINCSKLETFALNSLYLTNTLDAIDLTGCSSLKYLTIQSADITTINFADTTAIETIDLGGCQSITGTLDVSGKTKLTTLTIGALNNITSLKVTGCTALTEINALASAKLSTIVGLGDCSTLTTLMLKGTAITSLDFTEKNPALQRLNVENCTKLTNLILTRDADNTTFNSLTIAGCSALSTLYLNNCEGIDELDIAGFTALKELSLIDSGVTTFNGDTQTMSFSSNTSLKNLYLNGMSSFTNFDVSDNEALEEFSLTNNTNVTSLVFANDAKLKLISLSNVEKLGTLTISDYTYMKSISLLSTGLETLSVTASSNLTALNVYENAALESFSLTGATSLVIPNLSAGLTNYALKTLSITNSGIEYLDVTYLTAVTSLDVSDCASLTSITGLENLTSLTTLNVNGCTNLETVGNIPSSVTTLNANGSGITTLDASNCSALTTLDITGCTSLATLNLSNTKILGLTIDDTYTSLDSVVFNDVESTSGRFSINNNNVKTVTAQNIDVQSFGVTSTSVTSIDLTGSTIGDGGMMSFSISNCGSSLETLTVSNSNLTILPTETMSALKTLNAENCTGLTSIDMITMPNIENLNISGCSNITTIDLTDCTALTDLDVSDTGITELDVSSCTSLVNLNASGTAITALEANYSLYMETVDVSNCTSLEGLAMDQESNNNLTSVNVSGCRNMINLQIANSNSLQELDLSGLSSLSAAYLTDCTAITSIDISNTQMSDISSLNISALSNFKTLKASNADLSDSELADMLKTSLEDIDVSDNSAVTSIDLTGFVNLKTLNVSNTGIIELITTECTSLEMLDASECTALDRFSMSTNNSMQYTALQSVNVSGCIGMTLFELADATNLESLDLSGLTSLKDVYVQWCPKITSLDLSAADNIINVQVTGSGLVSGSVRLPNGKDESIITGLN